MSKYSEDIQVEQPAIALFGEESRAKGNEAGIGIVRTRRGVSQHITANGQRL